MAGDGCKKYCHGVGLAVAGLEDDPSLGDEPPDLLGQAAEHREPVAAAIERHTRIKVAYLRFEARNLGAGNVGRIADEDLEASLDARKTVRGDPPAAVFDAQRARVVAGGGESGRTDVGADARRRGQLEQQRHEHAVPLSGITHGRG